METNGDEKPQVGRANSPEVPRASQPPSVPDQSDDTGELFHGLE